MAVGFNIKKLARKRGRNLICIHKNKRIHLSPTIKRDNAREVQLITMELKNNWRERIESWWRRRGDDEDSRVPG